MGLLNQHGPENPNDPSGFDLGDVVLVLVPVEPKARTVMREIVPEGLIRRWKRREAQRLARKTHERFSALLAESSVDRGCLVRQDRARQSGALPRGDSAG